MSRTLLSRRIGRLFAVRALAETTTIPASTIYTLIAKGELPCHRIGRSVRVAEQDWLAYLEAQREVAQ